MDIIVANRMYSDALRIFASDKDFFKVWQHGVFVKVRIKSQS